MSDSESTLSVQTSVVKGTYLALDHMSKEHGKSGGVVINVSSMAGKHTHTKVKITHVCMHYNCTLPSGGHLTGQTKGMALSWNHDMGLSTCVLDHHILMIQSSVSSEPHWHRTLFMSGSHFLNRGSSEGLTYHVNHDSLC